MSVKREVNPSVATKISQCFEKNENVKSSRFCPLFIGLGYLCVALGFIGAVVPGMPTTVFLILAVWCFSRGSERCRVWLMSHPKYGQVLRDWHETRSIPRGAKYAAVCSMALSLLFTGAVFADTLIFVGIMAAVLVPVAAWIITRPTSKAARI